MKATTTLLAGLLVTVAACGSDGPAAPVTVPPGPMNGVEVRVGGSTASTDRIMSAFLVVAFTERGASVIDRSNTDGEALNRDDLVAGRLDVVPEDLTTGWTIHLGRTEEFDRVTDLAAALRVADRDNGIEWSDPSSFDDALAPVAAEGLAVDGEGRPITMEQLALRIQATPDILVCVDRPTLQSPDGLVRFERAVEFTIPVDQLVTVDADPLRAVADGECAVGFAPATSAPLAGGDLVVIDRLDDSATPPLVFPPRNSAYMFDSDLYRTEGQWLTPFIEALMVTLDRGTMTELRHRLAGGEDPLTIAGEHLESAGLMP